VTVVSRRRRESYHHYFLNPGCPFSTFTDYPEDMHLYPEWNVDIVLGSVMVYMHLRTTDRRAAPA
jgi:hypothetical protein